MKAIQKHAAHWFPWILQNLQWKGIKTEHELCVRPSTDLLSYHQLIILF